jgi:hypothetical protein
LKKRSKKLLVAVADSQPAYAKKQKFGAPLYTAQIGTWSNPAANAFLTLMQANGRVYAPAYRTVDVFGLTL